MTDQPTPRYRAPNVGDTVTLLWEPTGLVAGRVTAVRATSYSGLYVDVAAGKYTYTVPVAKLRSAR